MNALVAPQFAGPWPDGIALTRDELSRYVNDVADGSLDALATRCSPWSVRDVTIHLAETFRRFQRMLDHGRSADFTPPFTPEELDAENLRAVESFTGDPVEALTAAASSFLDGLDSPDEPMPHQLATLPTGLQVLFGLMDISIHHDDVLSAAGRPHPRPRRVQPACQDQEVRCSADPLAYDPLCWPEPAYRPLAPSCSTRSDRAPALPVPSVPTGRSRRDRSAFWASRRPAEVALMAVRW